MTRGEEIMKKTKIEWSEAFKLMQEHGVKEWSETGATSYSEGFCVLNNGAKILFDIDMEGPYSECTPDIDVQLTLTLVED